MKNFTLFTLLGSRASLIDLHLSTLKKFFSNDFRIVALMPDKTKKVAREITEKYENIEFVERTSETFNPLTPDGSYDVLLRKYKDTDYFLFNHDDTIYKSYAVDYLKEFYKNYDFFGAIDNASKPGIENPYSNILLDNIPFTDLRIGTWFLGGSSNSMVDLGYFVGKGKKEYPLLSNLRYLTTRLKVRKLRVTTDGGFNFNIKSRLDKKSIKIVNPDKDNIAEHFTRLSAGFANRGLLEIVDSSNEKDIWISRLKNLKKDKNFDQFKKDKEFLLGIYKNFQKYNIKDSLFNEDLINFFNEDSII